MKRQFSLYRLAFLLLTACMVVSPFESAFAQTVSTITDNMRASVNELPRVVSALSYLLAILFGAWGILKIKDHVESPQQTPMREGVIRLGVAGALLALPFIYRVMRSAILPGGAGHNEVFDRMSGARDTSDGINEIMGNIVHSLTNMPMLLSSVAYLLALVLGVAAILKLREHVESPQQTPMREAVIRFVVGGALFTMPAIYAAMKRSIAGSGSYNGGGFFDTAGAFIARILGDTDCASLDIPLGGGGGGGSGWWASIDFGIGSVWFGGGSGGGGGSGMGGGSSSAVGTVGQAVCSFQLHTDYLPFLLSGAAYLFGIILGIWGLMKLKDHVLNPQQTQIWEPVSRLVAAGAFLALPYIIRVISVTVNGDRNAFSTTGFDNAVSGAGLDAVMVRFMADIYGPMVFVLNWFGYIAGAILIMIGISRLLKSAQEGPRGPGGLGTVMTFIAGGALLAMSPMIAAFSVSLFGSDEVCTSAANIMAQSTGMLGGHEAMHVRSVISAVTKFMIVLGIISFARGIFIVRSVAEGNGQASMMAGLTHLIGGALAVNLGPVMEAVQNSLGLTGYGITFC